MNARMMVAEECRVPFTLDENPLQRELNLAKSQRDELVLACEALLKGQDKWAPASAWRTVRAMAEAAIARARR